MSTVSLRAQLSAQNFPFIAQHQGRTIVIPQYDQQFNPRLDNQPEDGSRDTGIPQVYYCHNVLPVAEGVSSAGFTQVGACPGASPVYAIFLIRDPGSLAAGYLFILTDGTSWFYNGTIWTVGTYVEPPYTTQLITSTTVMGRTFICVEGRDIHEFNYTTLTLGPVLFNFISLTDPNYMYPVTPIGITSGLGYVICWDKDQIYWSSTVDNPTPFAPVDFVPSDITGAGRTLLGQAKGTIKYCVSHLLGFMVYCQNNIVAGVATGNSLYPFNFRELVSSGGAIHYEDITQDAITSDHIVYTTSGLQSISYQQANIKFPELTDFISGRYFEDFDETTNTFIRRSVQYLKHAVTMVSDRYLMVSYGDAAAPIAGNLYSHALVFDTALKRWGKLKFPHQHIFEDIAFGSAIIDMQPKSAVMFVKADGTIHKLEFDPHEAGTIHTGVMILGKYQLARQKLCTLLEFEVESPSPAHTYGAAVLASLDGKTDTSANFHPIAANYSVEGLSRYLCRRTGTNISLLFTGAFRMSAIILKLAQHGRR
jgi:hypothetical protein